MSKYTFVCELSIPDYNPWGDSFKRLLDTLGNIEIVVLPIGTGAPCTRNRGALRDSNGKIIGCWQSDEF